MVKAKTITHPVRRARKEAGYTLAELGELAGMDPGSISNIERGNRPFTSSAAVKLEIALGLPPYSLIVWATDLSDDLRTRAAGASSPNDGPVTSTSGNRGYCNVVPLRAASQRPVRGTAHAA